MEHTPLQVSKVVPRSRWNGGASVIFRPSATMMTEKPLNPSSSTTAGDTSASMPSRTGSTPWSAASSTGPHAKTRAWMWSRMRAAACSRSGCSAIGPG